MDGEVVTAGAAQAGRVPSIENLAFREPHKAGARFRNSGRVHMRSAVFDNVTAHPRPFAMLTTAGERETAAHPIAAAYRCCLAGGGRGRRGCDPDIRIHFTRYILVEKSRN